MDRHHTRALWAALAAGMLAFAGNSGCDKTEATVVPVKSGEGGEGGGAKKVLNCGGDDWGKCLDEAEAAATEDPSKALPRYTEVCQGDPKSTKQGDSSLRGCVLAAKILSSGKGGVTKDTAKALKMLTRACDGKFADGCAVLGGGYMASDWGKPDDAKAATYLQQACDLGKQFSCADAAKMASLVKYGREKDWPALCEQGKGPSCLKLAMKYYKATPKDNVNGAKYFEKACNAGQALGCDVLAQMYQRKWVKGEKDVELSWWEKGCNLKDAISCTQLGLAQHKRKKYAAARVSLQQACDLDAEQKIACSSAGQLYLTNKGGKKELGKAKAVLQRACDAGESTACKQVADIDKVAAEAKKKGK